MRRVILDKVIERMEWRRGLLKKERNLREERNIIGLKY